MIIAVSMLLRIPTAHSLVDFGVQCETRLLLPLPDLTDHFIQFVVDAGPSTQADCEGSSVFPDDANAVVVCPRGTPAEGDTKIGIMK